MVFTCVSMVMSLTIFAYILGEISNLVMDQDAELVKTRSQVSTSALIKEKLWQTQTCTEQSDLVHTCGTPYTALSPVSIAMQPVSAARLVLQIW